MILQMSVLRRELKRIGASGRADILVRRGDVLLAKRLPGAWLGCPIPFIGDPLVLSGSVSLEKVDEAAALESFGQLRLDQGRLTLDGVDLDLYYINLPDEARWYNSFTVQREAFYSALRRAIRDREETWVEDYFWKITPQMRDRKRGVCIGPVFVTLDVVRLMLRVAPKSGEDLYIGTSDHWVQIGTDWFDAKK